MSTVDGVDAMASDLNTWNAAQVLRMHAAEREATTVPDPHARWRDLVARESPTATYRRGRCGQCRDDGTCDLLDAAQEYAGTRHPAAAPPPKSGQPSHPA